MKRTVKLAATDECGNNIEVSVMLNLNNLTRGESEETLLSATEQIMANVIPGLPYTRFKLSRVKIS